MVATGLEAAVAPSDSAARGKAARKTAPRTSHADFAPAPDREDPVAVLERQAATRVPELVPIRYGRMLASPFAFYRGAAAIMAADLAATPQSGLRVQCCGDAHLSNFGLFASPDRRLVFDLNDFDETLPGPWEWDVKRLAVSMLIAARGNDLGVRDQERVVLDCVASYRESIAGFAREGNLEVYYARFEAESVLAKNASRFAPKAVKETRKALAKTRTKDSTAALAKLTQVVDGEVRIVDQSPLIVPIEKIAAGTERQRILETINKLLAAYRRSLRVDRRVLLDQFELVDVARKVVGVGSVGTEAWITLLMGAVAHEPLFLQLKEAQPSVLAEHLGASKFDNQGRRVVVGQHLMQASSDIFLGWLRLDPGKATEKDFYGRQLKDWKGSAEIDQMSADNMSTYGRMCGWTLARAHARTGDRVAIAAYLGTADTFDRALLAFSHAYADQNERDYAALQAAVDAGRVTAELGL